MVLEQVEPNLSKKEKKKKKKETLHLDTDLIFFERKTNKQKNPSTGS